MLLLIHQNVAGIGVRFRCSVPASSSLSTVGLSPRITLRLMIASSGVKGTSPQSQRMLFFRGRFGAVGDSLEMSRAPTDSSFPMAGFA